MVLDHGPVLRRPFPVGAHAAISKQMFITVGTLVSSSGCLTVVFWFIFPFVYIIKFISLGMACHYDVPAEPLQAPSPSANKELPIGVDHLGHCEEHQDVPPLLPVLFVVEGIHGVIQNVGNPR